MSSHSASPYAAPPESNLLLILGKVKWNQSSAGGGREKWAAACTWAVPVEAWKISRRPTDDMKSSCGDLWKGWSGAAVAAVSEWGGETFRVPITAALFSSCASTQTNLGGGTEWTVDVTWSSVVDRDDKLSSCQITTTHTTRIVWCHIIAANL